MGDRKYQRLAVWQRAMDMTVAVYRLTERFPQREVFGLAQQMRRAAVSVPSNIAEGAGRGSDKEFIRFLRIAKGSIQELETQLHLCMRLDLARATMDIEEDLDHLYAMTSNMINALKRDQTSVRRQSSDVRPRRS
jgi:four helix bundle protein